MVKHIALNEKQKQFIKQHFSFGENLFDKVEAFEEISDEREIVISTSFSYGVMPKTGKVLKMQVIAYPKHVIIIFEKREAQ